MAPTASVVLSKRLGSVAATCLPVAESADQLVLDLASYLCFENDGVTVPFYLGELGGCPVLASSDKDLITAEVLASMLELASFFRFHRQASKHFAMEEHQFLDSHSLFKRCFMVYSSDAQVDQESVCDLSTKES